MRVLRDLESVDFALFTALCRFGITVGPFNPLIFEANDPIYATCGLNFDKMNHLQSLGLILFSPVGGYQRQGFPSAFAVFYGRTLLKVELKDGVGNIGTGQVMLTDAGARLATLVKADVVPGFLDYVIEKWSLAGHKTSIVADLNFTQVSEANLEKKSA